jgi:uncharacterized protein YbjT (DUF2867 family)
VILVTGATGTVGGEVVAQLHSAGVPVRAATRSPAAAHLPDTVEVAGADLSEPDTLEAALHGVDAVFLVWPFTTVEHAPAALDAIASHTRRLVYLSAAGGQRPEPVGQFHAEMERLVESADFDWTFLRPSGFASNALMWADQIRGDGVVRWPFGAAARSLIHERDIASVALRTLTEDGHAGAKRVLTGPALITQAEQVRAIGEAISRPTRWQETPPEAIRDALASAFGNVSFADHALATWARFVDDPELVTSTVEDITGAPPRPFRQWAIDHADDFR